MAAASTPATYNLFKLAWGKAHTFDLSSDTLKMALFTSSSNAANSALAHSGGTAPLYSDLTNEVSNGNGYTTGGASVISGWTDSSGTESLTVSNPSWLASASGITAEIAVLYDSTTGHLIGWVYLDSTPASVSTSSGNTLTLTIATGTWLTLA